MARSRAADTNAPPPGTGAAAPESSEESKSEMAILRPTKGLEPGKIFELSPGSITIGRNPQRCEIVLEHYAVSREHARIEVLEDAALIEDLDSRNGILINGAPIEPGMRGRYQLHSQDRIAIAAFEFVYEDEPSSNSRLLVSDETGVARLDIISTINVAEDTSRLVPSRTTQLETVLSIIEELGHAQFDEVLPNVVHSLLRAFPQAQNGYLLLRDTETGEFEPVVHHRREGGTEPMRLSRTLMEEVLREKSAILSRDVTEDPRFTASASVRAMQLRSLLCAPLVGREKDVLGLIQLEVLEGAQRFTPNDLGILAAVARHLAIVIENAELHGQALRAQQTHFQEQFRASLENSVHGIVIHRDFRPLFVNQAWAALHGYTTEEVLARESVLEWIAPADRQQARDYAASRLRGDAAPSRYEARGLHRDGHEFWLEKFTTVVDWDGGPAIYTAAVDLTARKQAEESTRRDQQQLETLVAERTRELEAANRQLQAEIAERKVAEADLRESVSLYHSLVDHMPLCVARKDLEGRFTFVNRALAELLGRAAAEIIGKTDDDFFPPALAKKYRRDDREVARTGAPRELYEVFDAPPSGGEVRHIHTLKTPILDHQGRTTGVQLIFRDVTAHRQTEKERNRYAQELERSNRDLEQFAHSVSHDLQSPLRTVTTHCQLVQRQAAGDAETDRHLEAAVAGTQRMKRLLDDLLDYARVTTEGRQFRPTDCEQVLAEALRNLEALRHESGAEVVHETLPTVHGDATQLMQVFQNLIGNAIRYRGESAPRVEITVADRGEMWEFCFADNGIGIDPQFHDQIFRIFRRLDDGDRGSGVGLTICKRIIDRHGGRIRVESTPGSGSRFYLTLRKADTAP